MFRLPSLSILEGNFPHQKQRFRANSIVEKARVKSILPLRTLQCAFSFGLLFLIYRIYDGWKQCNPNSNTLICSRVYRNAAYASSPNIVLSPNKSYKSSSSIDTHPADDLKDIHQLTIDINDFKLPSDIVINAKSPLWQSKSYFHESPESLGHRAAGYGNETDLEDAPYVRASLLRHLFNAFNAFAIEHDFVFWLAHGTLLGQYWGEKIMAEDTDVDVQTSIAALHRIQSHAGKLFRDRFELQVNPHYVIRKSANNYFTEKAESNVIDARWVDTLSGHFIDITALATSEAVAGQDLSVVEPLTTVTLQDKSVHYVNYTAISPLRQCKFEDLLVWCPADRDIILSDEYPYYKSPHHLSWRYNYKKKIFERMTCDRLIKMYSTPDQDDCDDECRQVTSHDRYLGWMYLVMLGEHHNQCQLEVIWTQGNDRFSRTYRGIHTGEDPAERMTSNTFMAIDWAQG